LKVIGDFISTDRQEFAGKSILNFAPMAITRQYLAKPKYGKDEYPPSPHPPLQRSTRLLEENG
jgi:hypothetical protein